MMNYHVESRLMGGPITSYQCPHCGHHLESPLHEAGTAVNCPFCQGAFETPGVPELQEQQQLEQERALAIAAEHARATERDRQRVTARRVKASQPPQLVWYGAMYCHGCGYDWKARRMTPPRRCHNCGSRNVEAVRVPKHFNSVGCVLMVFFAFIIILIVMTAIRSR
jgi:predicted Zn-ribbon and HTH transcriptional regulator